MLWDASMKAPKFSYDWNTGARGSNASVVCVKFNDIETSLFGKKNGMKTQYTYCCLISVQGIFASIVKPYSLLTSALRYYHITEHTV